MEAETNRALIDAARLLVVVADATKMGVIGLSQMARLEDASVVVTDARLDHAARTALEDRVGEVLAVEVADDGPPDQRHTVDNVVVHARRQPPARRHSEEETREEDIGTARRRPRDHLLRRVGRRRTPPRRPPRPAGDPRPGRRSATTSSSTSGSRWPRTVRAARTCRRPTSAPLPVERARQSEIPSSDYDVVVFENRFPSFATDGAPVEPLVDAGESLFVRAAGVGRAEVVCFTSDHNTSFRRCRRRGSVRSSTRGPTGPPR
jgi:hypothetical protein